MGRNTFTDTSSAAAIAASRFVTFTVTAGAGYTLSCTSISEFDYRHSATGPANGLLQYQIGAGPFTDIEPCLIRSAPSAGGSLSPINLSGISNLQNVGAGTNVTSASSTGAAPLPPAPGIFSTWRILRRLILRYKALLRPSSCSRPLNPGDSNGFGTTNTTGNAADTYVGTSDGMPNLLKYALGLNPLVATTNPVTGDISTGYLRLTVPRNPNATDVTFHVEVTASLAASWTTNGITVDQSTPTLLQSSRQHAGQFIRRRLHLAADHPPIRQESDSPRPRARRPLPRATG